MEIQTPEDFREQPVIDIEVEYIGGSQNGWTINDEPDNQPFITEKTIRFRFLDREIIIERRNVLSWSWGHRIDRIPVKQNGAPTQASQQPEGGVAGDEAA